MQKSQAIIFAVVLVTAGGQRRVLVLAVLLLHQRNDTLVLVESTSADRHVEPLDAQLRQCSDDGFLQRLQRPAGARWRSAPPGVKRRGGRGLLIWTAATSGHACPPTCPPSTAAASNTTQATINGRKNRKTRNERTPQPRSGPAAAGRFRTGRGSTGPRASQTGSSTYNVAGDTFMSGSRCGIPVQDMRGGRGVTKRPRTPVLCLRSVARKGTQDKEGLDWCGV